VAVAPLSQPGRLGLGFCRGRPTQLAPAGSPVGEACQHHSFQLLDMDGVADQHAGPVAGTAMLDQQPAGGGLNRNDRLAQPCADHDLGAGQLGWDRVVVAAEGDQRLG